jgi:hypothetical protein
MQNIDIKKCKVQNRKSKIKSSGKRNKTIYLIVCAANYQLSTNNYSQDSSRFS